MESGASEMFGRVLVAVDGSADSSKAADLAIDLAKNANAALFVVTVIHNPVYEHPEQGVSGQRPVDRARTEGEGFLKAVVPRAEAQGLQVRGEIIENVPSIADAIDDYAQEWDVDLVIVGTRGLSGLKKILLGSVSAALVSRAPCSVLVVR